MTAPRPIAERYPPWLVITAAALLAFVIGAAVIIIIAGYTLAEFVDFLGAVVAGIAALIAAAQSARANASARAARAQVDLLRDELHTDEGRHKA